MSRGAGVGAESIPPYGPAYPHKRGQDLQAGERVSDPIPLTAHVISGQSGGSTGQSEVYNSHSPGKTLIPASPGTYTDRGNRIYNDIRVRGYYKYR